VLSAPGPAADGAAVPRVLLIGLGPTSLSALRGLTTDTDVVAMLRTTEDETTRTARELGVPVVLEASLGAIRAAVTQARPDCVVVSSYDRILPADLIDACPFVNVHYAPLPRLRGRATVNWAILRGEDHATMTIHHLVAGLDAGGVLKQASTPVGPRANVTEVYDALNRLQQHLLAEAVRAAVAGDPGIPQDEASATYACTRIPADGEIDWARSTVEVDRLIRALTDPFPGAFTWIGLEQLIIDRADPVARPAVWDGRIPGRVVAADRATGAVDVLTGDGVLRLLVVRRPGGPPVAAATVLPSVKLTLGLRMSDVVARLQLLEGRLGTAPDDAVQT